nr:hypothetical protein OH820_21740 [Streptomyces sp. NBC_00857]
MPLSSCPRGKTLLRSLDKDKVQALMNAALGNDTILPMPDPETLARAAARVNTPRKPAPLRPFDDIAVERIRITGPTLTLLQDLLARQGEEFYGAQIHTRMLSHSSRR